mmetsp:Transcript_15022/g.44241  ORF Transcript_15022/g.44241 Transcript_15022/m.44241 type:complete len:204 (-) Transcript_15022:92-703(-)
MQTSSSVSPSSCLASPAGPGGHSPGEMSSAGTPAHSAPHRFPNVLPPAHTGSHSIVHMQVSSSSVSPAAPGTASAPHLPSTMSPFSKPAQLARQRLPKSLPPAQTGSYTSMQLHAASLLGPTGSPRDVAPTAPARHSAAVASSVGSSVARRAPGIFAAVRVCICSAAISSALSFRLSLSLCLSQKSARLVPASTAARKLAATQ